MKSRLRLALLAVMAIAAPAACRSPTDAPPNPGQDDDREDPGNNDGNTQTFITADSGPILV